MKLSMLLTTTMSVCVLASNRAEAGPIFLTGHDPDFHAQDSSGARNLLRAGLNYVTGGTYNDNVHKFLWVESRLPLTSGYRFGELGLNALGLVLGVNYDRVNAAELATVNLSNYTAIAVASAYGGNLRRAELDALIARKDDVKNFVNGGRGLLALSEGSQSGFSGSNPPYFGFLPITISTIPDSPPFSVTPAGAAAPFGLVDGDVNDPTHNSFGLLAGLTPLDRDRSSNATTLAGNVRIGDNGFLAIPEPASLVLFAAAGASGLLLRRRRDTPTNAA